MPKSTAQPASASAASSLPYSCVSRDNWEKAARYRLKSFRICGPYVGLALMMLAQPTS